MNTLVQILRQASGDSPCVLATLVDVRGSSYRRPGARMLFLADGRRIGGISGGCLEDDLAIHAGRVLDSGTPQVVTYDTTNEEDLVWGVGLGCHGVVSILIEKLQPYSPWVGSLVKNLQSGVPTSVAVVWQGPDATALGTCLADNLPRMAPETGVFRQTVEPPPALVVFGAGDGVRPLVHFAKDLGWAVTVVDPRAALATKDRFPEADAVIVGRIGKTPSNLALDARTFAVIMTHHYVHDLPLLRTLLPRPLAYLGLLGSRRRAEKILADLAAGGLAITPDMRSRLHAPVGLDLGADGPEEVALAILAEMKATLAGRDARPLRERSGPIHGS
jgi:xanthine dehydrogenase accessory factor